ncbi:MAG TPA: class GN sortase [Xanthomonadaceae bacterium]|nr:class GN sortase [Xanthomonadaceae bacterium]
MDAPTRPARPRRGSTRRARAALAAVLALAAALVAAEPAWLHAKATLAQILLRSAWADTLVRGDPIAPWPWADTHPVARLRVPRLGVDQIVLAGDSGRTLAFGPGWAEASAAPGNDRGTIVISGHRDTHFAFLRSLAGDETITLQSQGSVREYRVVSRQVVDARDTGIALEAGTDHLVLVTCWPFDAPTAGGPLRYVVTAQALERHGPDAS